MHHHHTHAHDITAIPCLSPQHCLASTALHPHAPPRGRTRRPSHPAPPQPADDGHAPRRVRLHELPAQAARGPPASTAAAPCHATSTRPSPTPRSMATSPTPPQTGEKNRLVAQKMSERASESPELGGAMNVGGNPHFSSLYWGSILGLALSPSFV
jgi:hypothetical protein